MAYSLSVPRPFIRVECVIYGFLFLCFRERVCVSITRYFRTSIDLKLPCIGSFLQYCEINHLTTSDLFGIGTLFVYNEYSEGYPNRVEGIPINYGFQNANIIGQTNPHSIWKFASNPGFNITTIIWVFNRIK